MLAPQCLPDTRWNIDELELWFEHISNTEEFDPSRVYLTGLSMGGFGTFRWVAKTVLFFLRLHQFVADGKEIIFK